MSHSGSGPYWYEFTVKNVAGYGDVKAAYMQDSSGQMNMTLGSLTTYNAWLFQSTSGGPFIPPFTVRVDTPEGASHTSPSVIKSLDPGISWDFGYNFYLNGSSSIKKVRKEM